MSNWTRKTSLKNVVATKGKCNDCNHCHYGPYVYPNSKNGCGMVDILESEGVNPMYLDEMEATITEYAKRRIEEMGGTP